MIGGLGKVKLLLLEGVHVTKIKPIHVGVILMILLSALARFIYLYALDIGYKNGYARGQFILARDLTNELGYVVSDKTDKTEYEYFGDINDLTIYIYVRNDVKTIASWQDNKKDIFKKSN